MPSPYPVALAIAARAKFKSARTRAIRGSKGYRSIPSGNPLSGCGRGEDYFPPGIERPAYLPWLPGPARRKDSGAGVRTRGAASLADVPNWRKPNKNRTSLS